MESLSFLKEREPPTFIYKFTYLKDKKGNCYSHVMQQNPGPYSLGLTLVPMEDCE